MMKSIISLLLALLCAPFLATAQVCDESIPPSGLTATYTPGTGALLQWTAVPFSAGVQISATTPSGTNVTRRLAGSELDQYLVPDAVLSDGLYTWRVQAACSPMPPYSPTPISATSSFTVGAPSTCPTTVVDVDGNVYPVADIGGFCVTAKNLQVTHFSDGSPIPALFSDSAWNSQSGGPAYCFVNGDASATPTYGLLYNWFAVDDPAGLCPVGWHVPSETDYFDIGFATGLHPAIGGGLKATGTLDEGTGLWRAPNVGATNSTQFTAIPVGERRENGDYSGSPDIGAHFWHSTPKSPKRGFFMQLSYGNDDVYKRDALKTRGLSVRCMKD